MTLATDLERQFMQRLRGAGWVKASVLPPGPRRAINLSKRKSFEAASE
jgi:hypothetical protein